MKHQIYHKNKNYKEMKSIARIEIKFIISVTIRDKGERNVAIQGFDQSAKTWLRIKNLWKMLQKIQFVWI